MTSDKAKSLIQRANGALGNSRVKLEIAGKGDWISLRGTFPPKPDSSKKTSHQQRISLKIQAIDWQTVKEALTIAKQIDLDLNRGTFDWRKFDGFEDPVEPVTVNDWVKKFEEQWRLINSNQDTWRTKYAYPFRPLLENYGQQELTVDLLKQWITNYSKKETDARKRFCNAAQGLAELAGLPTNELKLYKSSYSRKFVNPRDLPSDEEIVETWKGINDPGWKFFFGMLATYGLRPHEVFKFETLNQGLILIREDTKTGSRTVPPLKEDWVDLFSLDKRMHPSRIIVRDDYSNSDFGQIITQWFYRAIGWNAYNLRHAYARRWFERNLNSDVAAKFMGHSPNCHVSVYRAWIDEQAYIDLAKKLT